MALQVLERQGYWPSFNTPYFPEIRAATGYAALAKDPKVGFFFDHERPRDDVLVGMDVPTGKSDKQVQASWRTDV